MDWQSRFAGALPVMVLAAALYAVPASALDYQWGDVSAVFKTRVSFGAAWRMEDRDERLIGKTNVPGQQNLCAADDCISFNGDPAPNQRYVNAKGAYLGETYDDGDINYNRGEIVSATGKITPDLFIGWGDFQLKVRGVAFYDTVNAERDDFHTNTIHQPVETRRLRGVDDDLGQDFDFYEAYVGYTTTLMDHNVSISVGNQSVRWGESKYIALNTLNERSTHRTRIACGCLAARSTRCSSRYRWCCSPAICRQTCRVRCSTSTAGSRWFRRRRAVSCPRLRWLADRIMPTFQWDTFLRIQTASTEYRASPA
jgi:hypothetical protein